MSYPVCMEEERKPPIEPNLSPVQFNAAKHGIFSVSPVLPWVEQEEDWLAFRDSIFESIQPEGGLQCALADRVALLIWRMMRAARYEREAIARLQSDIVRDLVMGFRITGENFNEFPMEKKIDEMDRALMARLLPGEETGNKIMKHETRWHRQLLQTLHQIALLKGWTSTLPKRSHDGVANVDPPSPPGPPALPHGR